MKTYKHKCKNCGMVEHLISKISRSRGVKLSCSLCMRETTWLNSKFKQ